MKRNYTDYETEELVVMYQSTQQEEYLQEIIFRNSGLLHSWAWDYRNIPQIEQEDLIEEGYIACWRAVRKFDLQRGISFSTFLKVEVSQQYNRLYNEATRKKRFAGSEPVSYEGLTEINREGTDMIDVLRFEDYSSVEVREFVEMLEDTTKKVCVMLVDGMSKSNIAKSLGITPASVSYHVKRLQKAYIAFCAEV